MDKPVISFGNACFIVKETISILNDAGFTIDNIENSQLLADRIRDEKFDIEYEEENYSHLVDGDWLLIISNEIKAIVNDVRDGIKEALHKDINALDILEFEVDEVKSIIVSAQLKSEISDDVLKEIKDTFFWDIADKKLQVLRPNIIQLGIDMFDSKRQKYITEASKVHAYSWQLSYPSLEL